MTANLWLRIAAAIALLPAVRGTSAVQSSSPAKQTASQADAGGPAELDLSASELRPAMERFTADRGNLQRFYNLEEWPQRRERLQRFYRRWLAHLSELNFDKLSQDGKIDYISFRNGLEHDIRMLDLEAKDDAEAKPYVPFASTILDLEACRQQMEPLNPKDAAEKLSRLTRDIEATRKSVEAELKSKSSEEAARQRKIKAAHALALAGSLRNTLRAWFTFYDGYDPTFTWWAAADYRKADAALQAYNAFLGEHVLGLKPAQVNAAQAAAGRSGASGAAGSGTQEGRSANAGNAGASFGEGPGDGPGRGSGISGAAAQPGETNDIIGHPAGRQALMSELAHEMIPYTPEELIAIANKEFAWCENEMKRASREMGDGDDWKKALEKVKNLYVEPGKQPQMIRDLAIEAIKFMDDHDLVTIPPVARETWRMQMMTPQQQLLNPFFTGGEVIRVSYPTDTMSYEEKMMSMRGNNRPFAKATVFHELIPGHELQGYMGARFRSYRGAALGHTPFVTEGWSLYWEMLLWDMKFQNTPEERVGALFWRMHRCARIIFSLSFHLGKMTPDECVKFLVDRVGFERENAIGEVRRSFAGGYAPLYQAAYLLGGMQFYALHKELVDSGKMTNRQFHDAILKENWIPVEMIRADLTDQPLTRDYKTHWRFEGDVRAQ